MTENATFTNTVDAAERPADARAETLRLDMIERVRSFVRSGRDAEKLIPGLHLSYVEQPTKAPNCFYVLSVGLILQGEKHLIIGEKSYRYGTGSVIVTSVDMPTTYELIGVKPSQPFVSLSLRLNPSVLAELLAVDESDPEEVSEVFHVEPSPIEMLEDFSRLLALLERPKELALRAPIFVRDIHCLALSGGGGAALRALYAPGTVGQRIRRAIRWLRENFRDPVSVETLAGVAGMAPTTFHRHFKAFTSLSPLQYQKRLRLYEAQQFLLRGDGDVNSAAYAVGYQSPQQFNREYKRLFGEPPGKAAKSRRSELYERLKD